MKFGHTSALNVLNRGLFNFLVFRITAKPSATPLAGFTNTELKGYRKKTVGFVLVCFFLLLVFGVFCLSVHTAKIFNCK